MSQKSGSMFQLGSNGRDAKEGEAKRPNLRTVLGAGCKVEGKLVCNGPTRLDGSVEGELVADGFLLIDRNAAVTADLEVPELVVRGKVKGNIKANVRVTLEESAKVEGDIETPAISINDGAEIIGKVQVMRPAPAPREPALSDEETAAIVQKFAPAARANGHAPETEAASA